jgi:translation initiation factor IF-2
MDHGLVAEEWGGETICVPVSALRGDGLDHLLETILLVAEVEELRGDPQVTAQGAVIEAKLDAHRGPVATVLVRNGTLRVGDVLVIGSVYGRVRTMLDYKGDPIRSAGPATPVAILGLSNVPEVGERIEVVHNEREARHIIHGREA